MARKATPKKEVSTRKPVYLVFGSDEYEISSKAKDLVTRLCPEGEQALGLEIIDGAVDNTAEAVLAIRQCLEAVRTVGLFGGKKVVWLKDAVFFTDNAVGRTKDTKAQLKYFAEELKKGFSEEHILVVSATKVDKRSAFYKTCKDIGAIKELNVPERAYELERASRDRAMGLFREAGYRLNQEALEAFLQRAGNDTRLIVLEADKLMLYKGSDKTIDVEDVKLMVSPAKEALVWDLTDAVGRKNLAAALAILDRLTTQKENEVGLMIALEGHLRQLEILRGCIDREWVHVYRDRSKKVCFDWSNDSEADACLSALDRDPRKYHSFRLQKLFEQAGCFSGRKIRRLRSRALTAHERMISSPIPQRLLMDFFLVEAAR